MTKSIQHFVGTFVFTKSLCKAYALLKVVGIKLPSIYGIPGIIFVLILRFYPYVYIYMKGALQKIDASLIEAAESMGADTLTIILRVMLVEARVSLISGIVIMLGTVLGYSAMAGVVGGGGLGDIAIRYGYYRYQADIMIVTVILLVALVMILQLLGSKIALALDKRK